MNDYISDSKLRSHLQKYIGKNPSLRDKLPNLYFCGSQIIKQVGIEPAVFLLSDQNDPEKARFYSVTGCHSAWACPHCTAQVMAKKGTDIACAIDAMAKWYHKYAFMITFTLPHNKYMSCDLTFQILKETWRMFIRAGKTKRTRKYELKLSEGRINKSKYDKRVAKTDQRAKGQAGEIREYDNNQDIVLHFRLNLDIRETLRAYEFTWGEENGWHPHIHALFWTEKKNFKHILDYEQKLIDRWWYCAKFCALKILNKRKPDQKEENKQFVENLYTEWRKKSKDGHKSVYISRDNNGAVRVEKSSWYISGWSSDAELTRAEFKTAHGKNLTPFQILYKAELTDDPTERDKWLKLFTEYALATVRKRRVEFSKNKGGVSFLQLIEKWKRTQDYAETFKKKCMAKAEKANWKVAYWFGETQWLLISFLERTTNHHILTEILKRAKDIPELEKYLQALEIPLTKRRHRHEEFINSRIFENRPKTVKELGDNWIEISA